MAVQFRHLILSAVLAVPTVSMFAGTASAAGIDRVLAANGLVKTECAPGVVEIRLNLEKAICAVPTAQYPAGSYYFNEQGFAITPVGSSTAVSQPTQQTPTTTVVVQQGSTASMPSGYVQPGYTQPGYVQPGYVQPGYAQPGYAQPSYAQPSYVQPSVIPAAPVSPTIINVSNPSYPVSDMLAAQIGASLASRGLTPVACSANPGVTVVISGQYLACAYPTPQYPAGRYALQ